jgi:predicted Zn finger-like uncharacterized protein
LQSENQLIPIYVLDFVGAYPIRVVCPNCEANYEIPDDAIPDFGRDVQCANCGHTWHQMTTSSNSGPHGQSGVSEPTAVVTRRLISERLIASAPVDLEVREGKLTIRKAHDGQVARPMEKRQRIEAQRNLVKQLTQEAETKQIPVMILRRFLAYAEALDADEPTYILLDGPMAILSASLNDRFLVDSLDGGFLSGWQHLVACHEKLLEHISHVPDEKNGLDGIVLKKIAVAEAKELTDEAKVVLDTGRDAQVVGQELVDAIVAMQDYLEAASIAPKIEMSLLRKGMMAIAGTLLRITHIIAFPASVVTLTGWAVTPQGQEVLRKLKPIVDKILMFFQF